MSSLFFRNASIVVCSAVIIVALSVKAKDAQADHLNLIDNPSVETASTNASLPLKWFKGGYGTNTRVFSYPVSGFESARAMRTQITAYTNGDAKWFFEPVAISGGQRVKLSNVYRSNIQSTIGLQYKLADGTYKYPDLAVNLPASSDWVTFSKTFTVPTNYPSPVVSITGLHLIEGVGWVETDAFSLTIESGTPTPASPPSTTPPVASNSLIANPSVETASSQAGLPISWSKGGYGTNTRLLSYPVAGSDGAKAIRNEITSYASGGSNWYFKPVVAKSGDTFTFRDTYRSNVTSDVTIQYQLADGTFKYPDLAVNLPISSSWTKFSKNFTVPVYSSPVVNVTVFHFIDSVGWVETDAYDFQKVSSGGTTTPPKPSTTAFDQGMISLEFDDSFENQYVNAAPILSQAGINAGFYIITGSLGKPGSMTVAQVKDLATRGFEIGAHTRTHPHLTTLTPSQLLNEIQGSKQDLEAMGINSTTFVYPYGDFNASVKQSVKNAGYISSRSVNAGYNTKNSDPFALLDQHIENNTTFADVKAWIDQAKASRTWLIFEFHGIVPDTSNKQYSATPQFLQQIVDYIKTSGIKVVTTEQGTKLMSQ